MNGWFRGVLVVAVCLWSAAAVLPVSAVVFYATSDPSHNTTPPAGALAASGWELQGDNFPGTPIAPNFFITAKHIGGEVGRTFSFRGVDYQTVASYPHPDADITLWRINGAFPEHATIYTGNGEIGHRVVVFGRGVQRGQEIWRDGQLKGWSWGPSDGILRWGENVVSAITDEDERPATAATKFQLLQMNFDPSGGPNEAHLAGGDSGGGLFIQDGGAWKLAGVIYAANKNYRDYQGAPEFDAILFDERGFWEGEDGEEVFRPYSTSYPQPGSFYATRLSVYHSWIQSIVASGVAPSGSGGQIVLEESTNLFGPYTPVPGITVDTARHEITLPSPPGNRFYRLIGDRSYTIFSMTNLGNETVIWYD